VTGLASTRELDHDWIEYDETHKACTRCGLRLFWTAGAYGHRGWITMTHFGVPSPHMLTSGGGFGACTPPKDPPIAETVLIEYTGDPDVHPYCERYMHRLPGGSSRALVDLRTLRPVCGWSCEWWELGPARDHVGWTFCGDCFAGRGPARDVRQFHPERAALPPRARALPAPKPRQLKGK